MRLCDAIYFICSLTRGPYCEYRLEVMTVQTEGQYFLVQLEKASLFSSLLYGTQTKLVSIQFADCQERKRTVYDRFRGNGPYGKQNSRGYTLRLPYHIIKE